ncbi:hypothetical protein IMPR6_400035 [Imperialibacter sp. EC-SDR9]|nr:hypothetical protein IMPERIA89_410035 [Imperialibacter sp. 89]CAD5294759.1 hypothetical protein IMPERIA75_680015 [Imperialibacter sp. 75]VVT26846.1 hypothetical protein IMPR6_400035 [Imperialibacter sp. EC-SDR9]
MLLMLGGIFYFFMALTIASERSRYSPKVRITDDRIEFRRGFFQKNTIVHWVDITGITLLSFSFIFELTEGQRNVKYHTSASTSKEIKEAIREMAEAKGIEVDGG